MNNKDLLNNIILQINPVAILKQFGIAIEEMPKWIDKKLAMIICSTDYDQPPITFYIKQANDNTICFVWKFPYRGEKLQIINRDNKLLEVSFTDNGKIRRNGKIGTIDRIKYYTLN